MATTLKEEKTETMLLQWKQLTTSLLVQMQHHFDLFFRLVQERGGEDTTWMFERPSWMHRGKEKKNSKIWKRRWFETSDLQASWNLGVFGLLHCGSRMGSSSSSIWVSWISEIVVRLPRSRIGRDEGRKTTHSTAGKWILHVVDEEAGR